MNVNSLFNMLMKMFGRKAVDAGVRFAAGKGKPDAEMTPEERARAKQARELAQRAKKVARISRGLWR